MAFDLEHWQQKVRTWWTEHGPGIKSAYAILTTSAWLSFLAAYAEGKDK